MKKLIIIDAWEHCNSAIETIAKNNICKLISSGFPDKIYLWDSNIQTDKNILEEFKYINYVYTNDPFRIYDRTQKSDRFYFVGFHTNHCIFYNYIGIEKLLEILPVYFHKRFTIINDCSAGLDYNSNPISAIESNKYTNEFRQKIIKNNCKNLRVI